MAARICVFARVLVRRTVAAQCDAAGLARAQMNQGRSDFYALLALVAFWKRNRGDGGEMRTRFVRHNSHLFQELMSKLDAHRSLADGGSDTFD
jgi:hypothetical protein